MAASAPEVEVDVEVESLMAKVALECGGDISASQEEILATSSFLGGDNASFPDDDASQEEVFATPPEATQQQQEEDDPATMCTLPFTPTPTKSKSPAPPRADAALTPPSCQAQSPAPPSSADADDHEPLINRLRKPRISIRKVRGARIRTPTPSPEPQPQPEPPHVDPLLRAVRMIPTRTTTAAAPTSNGTQDAVKDFIVLARRKGIF